MARYPHLIQMRNLIRSLGRKVVGAEVGVYKGELSAFLLSRLGGLTLHMIDWWKTADAASDYFKSGDRMASQNQAAHDACKAQAEAVAAMYEGRAFVLQGDSAALAKRFGESTLDFVFIDADHTYEGVQRDLAAWWSRIRPGGMFSGHDYGHRRYTGVTQAVDEFCAARHLSVCVGRGKVWWTFKP